MAGIGFALDRLYRSNSIADRMASFAHASVVAAGPCLLSVLCIWLISSFNSELEGRTTIAEFRALVIYSFALSFVVTSPIALVSARLVSDRLHDRDVAAISGIMLASFGVSAVIATVVAAMLYGAALDLEPAAAVAAVANCALIALVWVGCLFCSVTRDYNAVTGFFAAGMLIAFAAVTVGYELAPSLAGMLWGFSLGLAAALFGLIARIIATFPFAVRTFARPLRAVIGGTVGYWPIALGGLFGAVGVWVDKWIVWLSPAGKQIQYGLLHAPLYDSAMFIAYLVVIPAYAAFVVHLEVKFFRNYRLFYTSILGHATLAQIRRNAKQLREDTVASLSGILVPQVVICALVALSAPAVIDALDMQFRQVGTLRLGVIGAVFQFLFITCASLTLYFDRRMVFLALQTCFLVLNGALTAATLALGPNYLGLGFLVASAISAAVAYLALVRTLYRLDYLTFIANNPAVRSRRAAATAS
ncbi:MAG: polysaccharide biosynthesis protein PelG [Alphaproteobacteria bacterium]|nr:polysaccharide biosynthesis protein PelG [Alphaproteobacteria bacterium]